MDTMRQDAEAKEQNRSRQAVMGRRQFLKWLGFAGAVAVVGAGAGLRGISSALATAEAEQQVSSEAVAVQAAEATAKPVAAAQSTVAAVQSTVATAQSAASTTSATCTVQCRNACLYPGHCKRYVDSNGNGRCDYGECL